MLVLLMSFMNFFCLGLFLCVRRSCVLVSWLISVVFLLFILIFFSSVSVLLIRLLIRLFCVWKSLVMRGFSLLNCEIEWSMVLEMISGVCVLLISMLSILLTIVKKCLC